MANCRGAAECCRSGASPIVSLSLKAPGAGACRASGPKLEHEGAIILLLVRVAPAAHSNVRVCSLIVGRPREGSSAQAERARPRCGLFQVRPLGELRTGVRIRVRI